MVWSNEQGPGGSTLAEPSQEEVQAEQIMSNEDVIHEYSEEEILQSEDYTEYEEEWDWEAELDGNTDEYNELVEEEDIPQQTQPTEIPTDELEIEQPSQVTEEIEAPVDPTTAEVVEEVGATQEPIPNAQQPQVPEVPQPPSQKPDQDNQKKPTPDTRKPSKYNQKDQKYPSKESNAPPSKEPELETPEPPVDAQEPGKAAPPSNEKKQNRLTKADLDKKKEKNKAPIKEEIIEAPSHEETNKAPTKDEAKQIPTTYTPPKAETIDHAESESQGFLVMFPLEVECKLYGVYQFIRETTPLNLITFYGVLLYTVYKVLGRFFGGSGVNGNVNFTYKIVDESAQAAILQHIDSAVQQPGMARNSSDGLEAPSAPHELLGSLADLTAKLTRLDQIESTLFAVQDSVKQVYSAQQEFQNEICESHQDIWSELNLLTRGLDVTPPPEREDEIVITENAPFVDTEELEAVQPEQPTVTVEQAKEEIGPVELQIETPEIRPPVIEEKPMKAPPVYEEAVNPSPVFEEKVEPPPEFEDPLEPPPLFEDPLAPPPVVQEKAMAPPIFDEQPSVPESCPMPEDNPPEVVSSVVDPPKPAAPIAPPKVYMPSMPGAAPARSRPAPARPPPRERPQRPAPVKPTDDRKGYQAPSNVSTSPFG